jgi:fluoride exporter
MLYVLLAVGGVAGTLCRYALGKWIPGWAGTAFPWGTLTINLAGSFVLGFLMRATEGAATSPEVRGMLTVGFCGAFTTFSTFTYEAVALLQAGEPGRAAAYAFGSVAAGLVAMQGGMSAAGIFQRGV